MTAGLHSSLAVAHTMADVEAELVASEPHVELFDERVADLPLWDVDGRRVRLSDFRGKVVVLNYAQSACGDACRSQLANIGKAQALLAEVRGFTDQVQFISIASDRVDAPGLNAFLRENSSGDRNRIVLREEVPEENRTSERAKSDASVLARDGAGSRRSRSSVNVLDPKGRLRARFHGEKFNPTRLMLYVAALAHGDHVPAATDARQGDELSRRIAFGALSSVAGIALFLVWMFRAQRRAAHRARRLGNASSRE